LRWMAFRKLGKRPRHDLLPGERPAWNSVSFYASKARKVAEEQRKKREDVLRDIRRDALIMKVPLGDGAGEAFLTVLKGKDSFSLITGKDGVFATSLSEAALHAYNAFGARWKHHITMTRQAQERDRATREEQEDEQSQRDAPWPMCEPNWEKLQYLHAHTLNGDKFIKPAKDIRQQV